ncbi:MAG: polyphosphate kinase 1 [Deltaproteobacteria bacterium]|nr:polyphosphate kinase 1 [Deltaproteobacteria bacterium]
MKQIPILNKYPLINREISWLYFNRRVLHEALDANVPLLMKLQFLAIFSSNLDEFYMIRVAGVKEQIAAGYRPDDIDEIPPEELLTRINLLSQQLMDEQQNIFISLKNECKKKEIIFVDKIEGEILEYAEDIWLQEISPAISPVTIGQTNPFPFIYNKILTIFVELRKGNLTYYSIITLENLERIYKIRLNNKIFILFAEQIILKFIGRIYYGYSINSYHVIRITRNADLTIEEGAEDLMESIEQQLSKRKKGNIVRVETNSALSNNGVIFLQKKLNFNSKDILFIKGGILDLSFLNDLNIDRPSLIYKPLKQYIPADIHLNSSIFKKIKTKDIVLYRPYSNFTVITKLIEISAEDPYVIAIKITLYRTNTDSGIVKNLIKAAHNGKQVSVIIELKARFEEEKNVEWAKLLEDSGCIVTYGFMNLKLHAKNLLIIRKENKKIIKYCHISTGNYNEITSKIYTDVDYITAEDSVGIDISTLFNNLMEYSDFSNYKRISVAPAMIRNDIIKLIEEEIKNAKKGKAAKIIAKINSLTDKKIIFKLYEASKSGVKIELIVRGICRLIPGLIGISDNISVKSIIGRFLEHSRILYFHAGGKEKIFISTADWMERNMDGRVELLFEIFEIEAKEKLKKILEYNLKDNTRSWILQKDQYSKTASSSSDTLFNCQEYLMEHPL